VQADGATADGPRHVPNAGELSSVGSRLRVLRTRAGLSQAALAERAGVDLTTVKAIERDRRRRPHPHTLARLIEALGLAPAERDALLALPGGVSASEMDAGGVPTALAAAPSDRPAHLPVPLTALIGRSDDVLAARALLDPATGATRLLTLVGPGGVGKTRLGLAVAAALEADYRDGVVFVDLAPLHDARLVPATIARALGVRESGGRSARELLVEHLHERHLLLLLDNFEHLTPASELLAQLLGGCPGLSFLVTSRAALRLRGEQRFEVAPLPMPQEATSLSAIARSAAVCLFVERAQSLTPEFELDRSNAFDIAAICSRLDGLPLAIELAAARIGLLAPAELLRRLQHRLQVLTEGAADLPERQQTLRRTLAWSLDLLEAPAQVLFARLGVFVGGWTVGAVEAVATDPTLPADSVLDALHVLLDSSLVYRVDERAADPRFEMLGTIREYALACLGGSGEETTIRNRHLNLFLTHAEQAGAELFGPKLADSLTQLDRDLGNLRAALDWAWIQQDAGSGLRLAGALAPFWRTRGYASEGRAQLSRLIARMDDVDAPAAVRARALDGAGLLANSQGDQQQAMHLLDRAIPLYRDAGDLLGAVRALNNRSGVDYDRGDLQHAMVRLRQCVVLAHEANDLGEVARALANLGEVYFHLGDLDGAETHHEQALALARRVGRIDVVAYQLSDLGNVARRRGQPERAASLHREALSIKRALVDHRRIAVSLEDMAALAADEGRMAYATRWLGAATRLRSTIGSPVPEPERNATQDTTARALAVLGNEVWATEFAIGQDLPLVNVIADALEYSYGAASARSPA
jgi:predicted ATPase/transcriptional regulator with XRE-family HTH domain